MNQNYEEIVISSGGINGISLLGGLNICNKYYNLKTIKYFTGCSFGSILCFLIVIGYTIDEINKIIFNIDFSKFQDLKIMNFIDKCGLDDGSKIHNLLKATLLNKNIDPLITFKELYEMTNKILTFTVTNITKGLSEYHNYMNTPDYSVLLSLRMSINIPMVFTPIIFKDNYYVDGALLDPFPYLYNKSISISKKCGLCLFDQHQMPFMRNNDCSIIKELNNTLFYFVDLIKILEINYLKKYYKKTYKNVIYIDYKFNINNFQNFEMSILDKNKLFFNGIKKAQYFFYKKYKKSFEKKHNTNLLIKYFNYWRKNLLTIVI
jgi:hypothetical protein